MLAEWKILFASSFWITVVGIVELIAASLLL